MCREWTRQARTALPGIDVEIIWSGMPVWLVGNDYVPDPDLLERGSLDAELWAAKPAKFVRDANDYWFHAYHPRMGDTIVDIGAGRGEDVFAFSGAVGVSGTVWAIEPHPESLAALTLLCGLNKLSNVHIIQAACVDVPRDLQIETMPVWESNYVREGSPSGASFAVKGIRFDDLCAEHGIDRIDFLKMNIEGAERFALPGCREALKRTRYACIAAHDFRAKRGEGDSFRTLSLVCDTLRDSGFEISMREDPRYYVPYHVHAIRRDSA